MAQSISLTSGSVLNGNPITFTIKPNVVTASDSDGNTVLPSFHRVILEVTCGMSGGDYETIKMSSPVEVESSTAEVQIDIASALRTFRDSYEYSPLPASYPYVSFRVKAYDEYMLSGEVHQTGEVFFPSETTYLRTLFGAFSDLDRLTASESKGLKSLTRKPSSAPQIVAVGETLAYAPPYSEEQALASSSSLTAPESKVASVAKEGTQTLGYQSVFALPAAAAAKRQQFRFINSLGVLESISVPQAYSKSFSASSTAYDVARQETFSSFSRSTIVKTNNRESWSFTTDPLNEDWLYWYAHEFLMAEHMWLLVGSNWLRCTVNINDDITLLTRTASDMYSLSFVAVLDINGSPIS